MNITYINLSFFCYFVSFLISIIYIITKKDIIEKIFIFLYSAAILLSGISVIVRWFEAGRPPFSNLYESIICFALGFSLCYIVFLKYFRSKFMHSVISLLSLLITVYAAVYTDTDIKPLMPALKSNWLIIHVMSYMISYGIITVSFVISCFIVIQSVLKKGEFSDSAARSPGLSKFNYKLITFAFPLLNLGLVTGAVWAKRAWGDYWSWDPKETWSLICWFYYVNYLHVPFSLPKIVKGLKKETYKTLEAAILIIGFLFVIFTYLGLKYLPTAEQSLHLYK